MDERRVTRHRMVRLVVLVLTVVATAAASVVPASALIPRSAFPAQVEVKRGRATAAAARARRGAA
jgi:hypothetical protein